MTPPTLREWLFSAKTFGAAVLALYVGFWLDLPRPYWAMATAYIASQPLSGATRSKAAYRACGTVLGAGAAVALVPALVDTPTLLSAALALWVGLCLFFALLDRTPRSYAFMLAGYTAPIIGFPSVSDPGAVFEVALARTEEILLGVVCATLVATLVFPRAVGPVLAASTASWLHDADRWAVDALAGREGGAAVAAGRRRLAAGVVEMDGLAANLAWDTSIQRDAVQVMRRLRQRMLMLLPVLSSITDRVRALSQETLSPGTLPPVLGAALGELRAWAAAGAPAVAGGRLRRVVSAAEAEVAGRADWAGMVAASLAVRLRELIALREACRDLQDAVAAGGRPVATADPVLDDGAGGATLHRDPVMALLSAGAAMLAVLLCCAFWIFAAWPEGAVAAEMAAVVCSFFAQQDDPVPAIVSFLRWSTVAVLVDAVYLFGLLPEATGFEMLALALAPPFLLYGLLAARPATASAGMALAANGATLLSLQETYNADFAAFANSGLALVVGMAAGAVITAVVRSVGAEWSARRLLSAGWGDLAEAAARYGRRDRERFAALMLDRLGLLAPRVAALEAGSDVSRVDALAEIRVGLNLVDLRRGRRGLPAEARRGGGGARRAGPLLPRPRRGAGRPGPAARAAGPGGRGPGRRRGRAGRRGEARVGPRPGRPPARAVPRRGGPRAGASFPGDRGVTGELALYGVLFPPLLLSAAALAALALLRRLLASVGFYRLVWHRALFVLLLGGINALSARWSGGA